MKRLIHIIYIAVAMIVLFGCQRNSDTRLLLDKAEAMMEEHPDSALATIESIDTLMLDGAEDKARYALLKTMAIDKNFIDTTDVELIKPASEYYSKCGSPTERLRTCYYLGRIYQNRGETALAMEAFTKGLEEEEKSDNYLTLARLLVSQGNIYKELYKTDKYIENNKKAIDYFEKAGREQSVKNCELRIFDAYLTIQDYGNARKYADKLKQKPAFAVKANAETYENMMFCLEVNSCNDTARIRKVLREYQQGHGVDVFVVNAMCKAGLTNDAVKAFKELPIGESSYDGLKYYLIGTEVYTQAQMYREACQLYSEYIHIQDSINSYVYFNDVQFIEERNGLELARNEERGKKERYAWLGGVSIVILLLGLTALYQRYQTMKARKRLAEERLTNQLQSLEEERDNLKSLYNAAAKKDTMVSKAVYNRLSLLNQFLGSRISGNPLLDAKSEEAIAKLTEDKARFMRSTRLGYAAQSPAFMEHLQSCGLTDEEQDYVCLYLLGLNGKDIGRYLGRSGHYNLSSSIRKKLNLNEHDTNLGPYVRNLLKAYTTE